MPMVRQLNAEYHLEEEGDDFVRLYCGTRLIATFNCGGATTRSIAEEMRRDRDSAVVRIGQQEQ